jgi:alpha-tubulin suppressor-like RCC1 family protein
MGRCDAIGYCSYPDLACETGYRFEANAGDGLGGQCVGTDPTGTGTDPTGNTTEPDLETGQDSTTTLGTATEPDPSSSSDDEPTTGDVCGGGGQACCMGNDCDPGLACSEGLCGCVQSVAVGDRHSCVVKLDGSVACWGANDLGQLATDPVVTPSSPVPLAIPGFGPAAVVDELFARRHTCVSLTDDSLWCWGDNTGQKAIVRNPSPTVIVPAQAMLITPAPQVGVGGTHTCVGMGMGTAPSCWGDNASGQLTGDLPGPGPMVVGGGFEPSQIALGQTHSCMSTAIGELYCWGSNAYGQLGIDPVVTPMSTVPQTIAVTAGLLVAGTQHTCILSGTDVLCWGRNDQGQLGLGTNVDTFMPTVVAFPPGSGNVIELVAAADQTCTVMASGTVLCWGRNQNGELLLEDDGTGVDDLALAPRATKLDFPVAQLATGETHSCALSTAGQVLCWGANGQGQIGDGTVTDALEPTPAQLSCP